MSKVKINDPVEYNGKVTTIDELDSQGLIEFIEEKAMSKRAKSGETIKYYAWLRGLGNGWEIGKMAYNSRMKKQSEREKLWSKIDQEKSENDYTYMIAKDRNDMYLFIDNSREFYKYGAVYAEYRKEEIKEWEMLDSEGNIVMNDLGEFEIDEYSVIDCDSFFSGLEVLVKQ